MSDLTKNIYVKNFSYHLPIIKGGGAKTYLEKRENIFIKGEKTQREQYNIHSNFLSIAISICIIFTFLSLL